jgi:hypothetical protein
LLAPDIIEAIVTGAADRSLMLEKLERALPASWAEQRARILEPKTSSAVWAKWCRNSTPITVACS